MKNRCVEGAIACVGAVIGAGFASGREVFTFFTHYGDHSWWLILLAATGMMLLCALNLHASGKISAKNWCELYGGMPRTVQLGSQLCATLLMAITGGAMVSASGHMVALLWVSEWAYPIGALGTLVLAWCIGFGSTRPLSIISAVLTAVLLLATIVILANEPVQRTVALAPAPSFGDLLWAAMRAVAYAAMNLTLAIGVVCKCASRSKRCACRLPAIFGWILVALLFVSNYLYLKHPELSEAAFPIVNLLSVFGRSGFVASVMILYLAILTTLIAIVCALRNAVDAHVKMPMLSACITLGLPLAISLVGFAEIVQSLYAPAGLCCLMTVFFPLMWRYGKQRKRSDKEQTFT